MIIQIFLREVNSFLNSLIAYIVIGVFLTAMGLMVWVFPETSVLEYGFSDLYILFTYGPYVFMFLIPAITMRSFAEEKKAGTMELLLTHPLSDLDIIIGKFLASFFLVILALFPTVVYYYSVYQLGSPVGNIDTAGVIGSYIGLIFLGGVFAAIGTFASSITQNQIVAFILGVFFCFLLYSGFNSVAAIDVWSELSDTFKRLGILHHYNAMSKGLIDSRNLIYFLSVIVLMIVSTHLVLRSRKW